jgi:small neutral amino acid transporter SnatA (MarC family)
MNFTFEHQSRRENVASTGFVVLFTLLALAGYGLLVFGVFLYSRPAAFIVGGLILCVASFLGALGKSGSNDGERL